MSIFPISTNNYSLNVPINASMNMPISIDTHIYIYTAIFPITITGWWCNNHLETYYESQFCQDYPIYEMENHPFMFETTNQIHSPWIYPFSQPLAFCLFAHLTWKLTAVVRQILEGKPQKKVNIIQYRIQWQFYCRIIYPLVNSHNYGKSPFSIGKSTINGYFQ